MEGWFLLAPGTVAVASALTVVALCTEHWTETSKGYAGLWKGCALSEELQKWICGDTQWPHSQYVVAVRVLLIMSVAIGLFTAVTASMAYINKSAKWSHLATVLVIVQEIFLAVGMFTFLGYICRYGNRFDLSWSYALGWISLGFYVLSNLFFTQQAKRLATDGQYYQNINAI